MPASYDHLWQILQTLTHGPTPSLTPPSRNLPAPWTLWTLLALFRHRSRQLWVGNIVATCLDGDLATISAAGSFGHPSSRRQTGLVPGHTQWEYCFHGRGCCLTNRITGESIDVDFHGNSAEYIDFFFYRIYLESLRPPQPVEQRLIDLHPNLETIQLAFDDLLAAGILIDGPRSPRLAPSALAHADNVAAFCEAWSHESRRPQLAAAIGDSLFLVDSPHDLPDHSALASHAASLRNRRRVSLLKTLPRHDNPRLVLQVLADLGAPELPDLLAQTLRGPICGATCQALDIVITRPDKSQWSPHIYALFQRLNPSGNIPQPILWIRCLSHLLREGYNAGEMMHALDRPDCHALDEAALLALEFAPHKARSLFRRALRSSIPHVRTQAAAALAIIDQTWCHQELLAVLADSTDQTATVDCRAALKESRHPEIRAVAENWETQNPHEPSLARFITMEESHLRSAAPFLEFAMDQLRPRVTPLASRLPP